MHLPTTNSLTTELPLVIPTRTQQPTARLLLRNDRGQVVQQWLVKQNKCTLGSASSCSLRCELPGMAPYHALLVIGARQIFIRALAPKLTRDGRPFNEILLTDEDSHFEISGHRFELNRNHETLRKAVQAESTTPERLKFTLARPFELSSRKSVAKQKCEPDPPAINELPSENQPSTDSKWVAQLIQAAIQPLECQLHNLIEPLTELQSESRKQRRLRRKRQAVKRRTPAVEATVVETPPTVSAPEPQFSQQVEDLVAKQAAAMDVLSERISDVNQQLSTIERIISDEREAGHQREQDVAAENPQLAMQTAAVEQLQVGIVTVSSALERLQLQQAQARDDDQHWKSGIQDQLDGLTQVIDGLSTSVADIHSIALRDVSQLPNVHPEATGESPQGENSIYPAPTSISGSNQATPHAWLPADAMEFSSLEDSENSLPTGGTWGVYEAASESAVVVPEQEAFVPEPFDGPQEFDHPFDHPSAGSQPTEPSPQDQLSDEAQQKDPLNFEPSRIARQVSEPTDFEQQDFEISNLEQSSLEQEDSATTGFEQQDSVINNLEQSTLEQEVSEPTNFEQQDSVINNLEQSSLEQEDSEPTNFEPQDSEISHFERDAYEQPEGDALAEHDPSCYGPSFDVLESVECVASQIPDEPIDDDHSSYDQPSNQMEWPASESLFQSRDWQPVDELSQDANSLADIDNQFNETDAEFAGTPTDDVNQYFAPLDGMPADTLTDVGDSPLDSQLLPESTADVEPSLEAVPYEVAVSHGESSDSRDPMVMDHLIGTNSEVESQTEGSLPSWWSDEDETASNIPSWRIGTDAEFDQAEPELEAASESIATPPKDPESEEFFGLAQLGPNDSLPGEAAFPPYEPPVEAEPLPFEENDPELIFNEGDAVASDASMASDLAGLSPSQSVEKEPVQQSTQEASPEAAAVEQKAHDPSAPEDDSVEEYMRKLLARMRGVPEHQVELPKAMPSPVVAAAPTVQTDEKVDERQPATTGSGNARTTAFGNPREAMSVDATEPFDPEKYMPRALAPERSKSLAAMRELANSSARTAIHKSTRQRYVSSILLKSVISLVGAIVGIALIAINGLNMNIGLVATVASFLVAAIWGYDSISSIRPMLQAGLILRPQTADSEDDD